MLNPVNNKNMSGSELADMADTLMGKFSLMYLITPSQRYEDAIEFLKKSANAYKLESNWEAAAHGYLRIVKFINSAQSKGIEYLFSNSDIIDNYLNAAHCFDKINSPEKFKCKLQALDIYKSNGDFKRAGKLAMQIAESYEKEFEKSNAVNHYKNAIELFQLDKDKHSESVSCLNKIAEITIGLENNNYLEVLEIYKKIIEHYQSVKLGQYQLKNYICMYMLVSLCYEPEDVVRQKFIEFAGIDYSFESSNEGKFICNIIQSVEESDIELFSNACFESDRLKPFNPSMVTLLNVIKKRVSSISFCTNELDGPEEVDLT